MCFVIFSAGSAALAYQNPTANAGPNLYLTSGQTATLQGSGYDPNGYALTYYWTCSGGTLSSYNIVQPVYTASYVNNNNQTAYTCTLTVINNYGGSNSDSMVVYINYNNSYYVQTTYATYISNFQATLNGSLSNVNNANLSTINYAYFQWGATNNYGNETSRQSISYATAFMQNIANLNSGTIYHFRAAVQNSYGTVYGQDMTFTTSGAGPGNNSSLAISKQAINLSSGKLNWSASVNASPSDVLSFAITLQANGQDIHNVIVRDVLPANLIYMGSLTVNGSNYSGNITSGINVGTINAAQAVVVAYKAEVAPAGNFSSGTTTITNNAIITSHEVNTQTASATVIVNKTQVYGASIVSTGLTNNFLTDSFFLPLFLIILLAWLYFTGKVYDLADWLKQKI